MALISFGYRVDMYAIDPPADPSSFIVAYDLDGVLKQKDYLGVVTLIGTGAGGPQGPPGPVGPAGLTWSGPWIATQSYSENYAVGYGSASWWCISAIAGATSNSGPDIDTTHWALLAAQGSPGSQGPQGVHGNDGPQGLIGLNWVGDWIINVYGVRDAVYYNGSSYVCIASTVGTETLSPDTNIACWKPLALKGDVGPQGATGSPGISGATGASTLQDIFYNIGGTVSATNSTMDIYRTGSINIGTGTASNSRFLVSSSGGTNSLVVNEQGDVIFRGDTTIIGTTFSISNLPPGSITFGSKTAIYSPGNAQIVIGTDTSVGYNYQNGWKFTGYQITNLWGNAIEFQNPMGTIGNLWVGSNYTFAGFNPFVNTQQSTLFVKGTTTSIMRVVGTGATWSNSQSIFEINNSGAVSIGTSQSMSDSKLFIQSSTSSTTIGSNVMLDLYNGDTGTFDSISEIAFSQNGQPGASQPYNVGHRYALISGYAISGNNAVSYGGIKFSTRATTGSSLVTSLVLAENGSVYNDARGSNTLYGLNALLVSTGINNTAIGTSALQNNLGGLLNTAVGMSSMASNTSGNYNTAVGAQALTLSVSGSDNVAIGIGSQQFATQSSSNVSVGRATLNNNLSSGSVAIGSYALTNNIIGLNNTAVGHQSLFNNTTSVSTIDITNGGSGYTMSSTFSNVQLSYISGNTATTYPIVTIYVGAGGTVSTATLVTNGTGFKDTTTVMGANLGTGVTFSVSVSSLNAGSYNTAIGYNSLYSNTTGDNNVALGYQALYNNTTGIRNTALGHHALLSNTTGVFNIAIGNGSLQNNISGIGNISLGEQTLFNNNANYNIALGAYALVANISGTGNIAIGIATLASTTTNSNNIAIGYDALYNNTSDQNTAIGWRSLYYNTTGYNNTALGLTSLFSNISGYNNTAIGYQSLYYNTIGITNTALGFNSLYSNTIGSNNTAVGHQAGSLISGSSSGATNSNNSVFIGYDTRPQADGQTNQIVIGYGATGNGSNSVSLGNDSITKTILKGNVGIGTDSPSTKLHIYATQSGAFQLQDGSEGVGLTLISDEYGVASWTSSTILVTGTFGTLESLVSNNELVIGGSYILLGYQTIYQINGSNTTGIVQLHTVIGAAASVYSQFVNVPSEIGGPSNFAGVTVTVESIVPGATLTVGQSLTIVTWFSPFYIQFSPTVVGVNIGCTLKFEKQRYSNVIGGATYSDIYGKPIMKPGGVLNIEVHDGTPYMSMTASENPPVLTESIILTAIDTNKFSRDAESLTFPGDKLVYDYTDKYVYDENGNIIANKPGTIIQRTNISGSISMNKDWRVQRYRRYGVDSTNWSKLTLATASIYKIGANSLCTTTNPSISTDHRYIATDPYIFNFFTDFNKNYTGTSSIFVTGTSSAPSMNDGSRASYILSGNEYSNDLNISSFTSSVKDFNIIPIVNGEPTNLIEKCIVNDVSNTVFLPYSQTYGTTFDLDVDSKNGNIKNSTFATLPLILNTGTINKLSVIDYMIINNFSTYNQGSTTAGSILNTLMLSYASLSNTGQIVNTTIGGGAGASTAFNSINFSDSTIYNCVIGGHRNNSMEISKLKANKSLICFNASTLVSITGNSYLTALKNQSTSFYSSIIKLNNFDTINPNKALYGYLYDFNLGLSDLELNNNTLDKRLVYQYLDNSNNTISVTASIAQ